MRFSTLILLILGTWAFTSCNGLKKALNKGLQDQNRKVVLDSLGKKIGKGVVKGATEELSSDTTAQRMGIFLNNLTDSVTTSTRIMMDSLFKNDIRIKQAVAGIVDTLQVSMDQLFYQLQEDDLKNLMLSINQQIRALPLADAGNRLRQSLIGKEAIGDLMLIRDSLLGIATRRMAKEFMGEMVNQESTDRMQAAIRETLDPTIEKIFREVNNSTEQGLNFAQRNITQIIVLLSLLGAAIVFFFKNQRDKYDGLVRNLTLEIEKMDDPEAQKELKRSIRDKATAAKLEPLLRGILIDQGIVKDR